MRGLAKIAALALAMACSAGAVSVTYSTTSLGGGLFDYDFQVNNSGGSIPIAGLLVEAGNTEFALDSSSTITAPPGWDFISPLPPFDDELSYFSLTSATDIPIGGSLGGLDFVSSTDPSTISEVDVILVGSDSSQTPYTIIPEPIGLSCLGAAAIGVAMIRRTRRRWATISRICAFLGS